MSARYSIVEATVTGHRPYGVLVDLPAGESGYLPTEYLADPPETVATPEEGQRITAIMLNNFPDGRVRLTARPSDVELARSTSDLVGAIALWDKLLAGHEARQEFLAHADAAAVLSWARKKPADSPDARTAQQFA